MPNLSSGYKNVFRETNQFSFLSVLSILCNGPKKTRAIIVILPGRDGPGRSPNAQTPGAVLQENRKVVSWVGCK